MSIEQNHDTRAATDAELTIATALADTPDVATTIANAFAEYKINTSIGTPIDALTEYKIKANERKKLDGLKKAWVARWTARAFELFKAYDVACPLKYLFQNTDEICQYDEAMRNLDTRHAFNDVYNVSKASFGFEDSDENLYKLFKETMFAFLRSCVNDIDPENGRPAIFYARNDQHFSIPYFVLPFDWFYTEDGADGIKRTWVDIVIKNGVSFDAIDSQVEDIKDGTIVKFLFNYCRNREYVDHMLKLNDEDLGKIQELKESIPVEYGRNGEDLLSIMKNALTSIRSIGADSDEGDN
jgi:hypothetical protein